MYQECAFARDWFDGNFWDDVALCFGKSWAILTFYVRDEPVFFIKMTEGALFFLTLTV